MSERISGTPLFICGSGRSGTTALYRLLETHPELALTNEAGVADLLRLATELAAVPSLQPYAVNRGESTTLYGYVSRPYLATASRVLREHAIVALEEFYAATFEGRTVRYWGDKLPEPETVIALQAVYPELRALVLLRDPRDVLCSLRSFGAREQVAKENRFMAGATAETFAPYWANVYDGLTRYGKQVYVLRYEDLIRAPVDEGERILDWLGLPCDAAQREAMHAASGFTAHGTAASTTASVARWRSELTDDEVATIEAAAGEVMERFGYARAGRR
jgi:hypothetical protein